MDILRFATAGSVDDGKSTLIGRLLYDSKAIFEDQLQAVERTSRDRGEETTNLALLTDGLRAEREQLEIPSIYFAHDRQVFERDGILLADNPYITRGDDEPLFTTTVRYRTVGDMACTGAVASTAATVPEVIAEIAATRITERGQTRADDRASEAAMEDRKREGYF